MKSTIKKLVIKAVTNPLVERAAHTFWQAFASTFTAGWLGVFGDFSHGGLNVGKSAALALFVGALAAGFSALKTAGLAWYKKITVMA